MEQKAFADQANKELIDRQVAQCRSDSQRARIRDKLERKFLEKKITMYNKQVSPENKVKTIESVEETELL